MLKILLHPRNRKFAIYRKANAAGPLSHRNVKLGEVGLCGRYDMQADRQTDGQTDIIMAVFQGAIVRTSVSESDCDEDLSSTS